MDKINQSIDQTVYEWMRGWVNGWMDGWMDGWTDSTKCTPSYCYIFYKELVDLFLKSDYISSIRHYIFN